MDWKGFASKLFLFICVVVGIGDVLGALPAQIDFADKLLAYVMMGWLWYEMDFSVILTGEKRPKLNWAILISFYLMSVQILRGIPEIDALKPEGIPIKLWVLIPLVMGQLIVILVSAYIALRVTISKKCFIYAILYNIIRDKEFLEDFLDPDIKSKLVVVLRFVAAYFLTQSLYLFFFEKITQWIVLSLDKSMLLMGLFYGIHFSENISSSQLAKSMDDMEEMFLSTLADLFINPRKVHLGLCGVLIAQSLAEIGWFLLPFTGAIFSLNSGLDAYFSTQFGMLENSYYVFLHNDLSCLSGSSLEYLKQFLFHGLSLLGLWTTFLIATLIWLFIQFRSGIVDSLGTWAQSKIFHKLLISFSLASLLSLVCMKLMFPISIFPTGLNPNVNIWGADFAYGSFHPGCCNANKAANSIKNENTCESEYSYYFNWDYTQNVSADNLIYFLKQDMLANRKDSTWFDKNISVQRSPEMINISLERNFVSFAKSSDKNENKVMMTGIGVEDKPLDVKTIDGQTYVYKKTYNDYYALLIALVFVFALIININSRIGIFTIFSTIFVAFTVFSDWFYKFAFGVLMGYRFTVLNSIYAPILAINFKTFTEPIHIMIGGVSRTIDLTNTLFATIVYKTQLYWLLDNVISTVFSTQIIITFLFYGITYFVFILVSGQFLVTYLFGEKYKRDLKYILFIGFPLVYTFLNSMLEFSRTTFTTYLAVYVIGLSFAYGAYTFFDKKDMCKMVMAMFISFFTFDFIKISLSFLWPFISRIPLSSWIAVTISDAAIALIIFVIAKKYLNRDNLFSVKNKKYLALVLVLGVFYGFWTVHVGENQPPVTGNSIFGIISLVLAVGFAEELLYRFVVFESFIWVNSPRNALLMQAYLFAIGHSLQSITGLQHFALLFSFGYIAGHIYKKTNSLAAPILFHIITNFVAYMIRINGL